MRHDPDRPVRLVHGLARPRRHLPLWVVREVGGADERFGQIHRVVGNGGDRKHVAVAHDMRGCMSEIATRYAVQSQPVLFQMGRLHDQRVAFPMSGRESRPGVARVFRRMRTAVHPDGLFGSVSRQVRVIGDDFLRLLVDLFPDPEVRRATPAVVRAVGTTLVLGELHHGSIPTLGAQLPRGVDGIAQMLADIGARKTLGTILIEARPPIAGGVDLCQRGTAREQRQRQEGHPEGNDPACGNPPLNDPAHPRPLNESNEPSTTSITLATRGTRRLAVSRPGSRYRQAAVRLRHG